MISYSNYINLLNDKRINIFDHQKRLSHYKLNNIQTNNIIQKGGGVIDLYKLKDFQLEKIIFKLLDNEDISEMLKNYYTI